MSGQRTLGQYRAIDLTLFALMMSVGETLIVSAATKWFPGEMYILSVVPAVTAIVLMRWGAWGAVHAALGGLVFCLAMGKGGGYYVVYGVGNLAALGVLWMRRTFTPEGVRQDAFKTVMFGILTALMMQAGRALMSLVTGAGAEAAAMHFTTDVLSVLFSGLIVWIARRQNGIFEDQMNYLLRVAREQEEEKEKDNEG